MPASRAACSGSPFLTAPERASRRAVADIVIDPRATASRSVIGLSPTSTILIRPCGSTCEGAGPLDFNARREKKREALERDSQVHAFQLHVAGRVERPRREVQHGS